MLMTLPTRSTIASGAETSPGKTKGGGEQTCSPATGACGCGPRCSRKDGRFCGVVEAADEAGGSVQWARVFKVLAGVTLGSQMAVKGNASGG